MRGAHEAEGTREEFEEFLHAMAQLQARQLKLRGEVAHTFAGRGAV